MGKNGVLGQRVMLRHRARKAYSLLEVVLAGGICATALVPALALMRDSMTVAENIDTRHLLLVYGVSKMEEQLAVVAATWATGASSGDFAAEGHANLRYTVVQTDDPASGGITGRLMSVTVTTYCDVDGDDTLDTDEMRSTLSTKIGKFVSYENMASS